MDTTLSKFPSIEDDLWEDYRRIIKTLKPPNKDLEEILCKECSTSERGFIEIDGFVVCGECGIVQDSIISKEADWNNYTSDTGGRSANKSRCGGPNKDINPFADSLSTYMPKGMISTYKDSEGKLRTIDLSRLHMQKSYNHKQKSFDTVKNYIENISADKYPEQIIITSERLWGEIMRVGKVTRAGVRKGLIACCLYYACLHHGCTQLPIQICKDFGMSDTKQFIKGDKEFKETFENHPTWGKLLVTTTESDSFFIRFCNKLGLNFQILKQCNKLYEECKVDLLCVVPKSAAAGIIYYVCKKNGISITKCKICKQLNLCNPTLTKTLKIINKFCKKNGMEKNKKVNKKVNNNDKFITIHELIPLKNKKKN
jgi:transcription initiation factor TFIIIB Brf1 subunit/transcription initiation factor TFIIB